MKNYDLVENNGCNPQYTKTNKWRPKLLYLKLCTYLTY